MGKQGTNSYWATLMPVFSSKPKNWQLPDPMAMTGLLFYVKHEDKIKFSDSVLDAMQAEAPVITPDNAGSLLQSSIWDGPKIFQDYILESVPATTMNPLTSVKPSAIHISNDVKEQMQNEFLVNCGLYIQDPTFLTKTKSNPIIPNPDFDLAEAVMDSSWGTTPTAPINFVAITGEEFYQLLGSDNYGFSTTLIFPNQDLVDKDVDSLVDTLEKAILDEAEKKEKAKEKARKLSYEEWLKKMKEKEGGPGSPNDPWGPSAPDPYKKPWDPDPYPSPKPRPNPYTYPPDDDWNPKPYDYEKYKEWMQKKKDWDEAYDKSNAASSASQIHNK